LSKAVAAMAPVLALTQIADAALEVVGEATLKTEVTVSPSADFLARVHQTVQNGINAFRSSGGPATGSSGSRAGRCREAGPPQ